MKTPDILKPVAMKWLPIALTLLASHFCVMAQDTIYATSQAANSNGLCLDCRIFDRNNAVNNDNLNDYATLFLGTSLLGAWISQTLIFPQTQTDSYSEITIEIANNDGSPINLLDAVTVSTSLGGIYNNDRHMVPNDELVQQPNSNRAIYKFLSAKPFDRVNIELHGGILAIGSGLRVYYAYTTVLDNITACGAPPRDAYVYYPLNGHVKDAGPRRLDGNTINMGYSSYGRCDSAACDSSNLLRRFVTGNYTLYDSAATFAFWIKNIPGRRWFGSARVQFHVGRYHLSVSHDGASSSNVTSTRVNFECDKPGALAIYSPDQTDARFIPDGQYHHIVATIDTNSIKVYIDGELRSENMVYKPGGFIPYDVNTAPARFEIRGFHVDELLVYNRCLNNEEVAVMYEDYTGDTLITMQSASFKSEAVEDNIKLAISPNPTTGTIQINEGVDIANSIAILNDLSGTERYRTYLSSRTIRLPEHVSPGVYILRLITRAGTTHTAKVVVVR